MCKELLETLETAFEKLPGSQSKMNFAYQQNVSVDTIYKVLQGKRRNQNLIDFVIALINYSKDLSPLQCIASQCNALIVPLKSEFTLKDNSEIFKSIKELSDYAGTVAEGMADNKIKQSEAKKMLKEAEEAFRQLGITIQYLNKVTRNG